jgi:transposase-like protein
MKGHGSKFSRKKEVAIAALISHRTVEEAARAVGIGHNTLLRWMKMPDFKSQYLSARAATLSQTIARVQQASQPAATTILRLMADPKESGSVRLRAAVCVLDISRLSDWEALEVRVGELERSVENQKKR